MKIYKYKRFKKWAASEKLSDAQLISAVKEINNGLYEADLGSGLYKKRIAAKGKGKRGGYRTLLAFKENDKAFFVYGFSKNVRSDIEKDELTVYKILAKTSLALDEIQIKAMIEMDELTELNEVTLR